MLPGRLFGLLGNVASPWGLAAFLVGRRSASLRHGALAGALALVVGVVVYYALAALRGSVVGQATLVWTVTALVAGPTLGLCGAATSARSRPPVLAVVAPAAMLAAEAFFLLIDRRVWRWNVVAEPYRLIDLAVAVAFVLGAFTFPFVFAEGRRARAKLCLLVAAVGVVGAFALIQLERIVAGLA